jgi:cytochrome P450
MQSYTFSGGFHVPAGNLVAIPQREMMRGATYYPNPNTFDPYRFMTTNVDDDANTKYTHVN